MKKIITILLCALLTAAMAITASAAAYMGLSASASTLYPGDEFTVTVSLSNTEPVGRGGIVLNYNAAVFQMLGGSCHVDGATLAEVSPSRNGGVFALAENRVVSGAIFTIRMRVREDAPLGSYTISGTGSMDVSCSAGSVSLNVSCKHSYDLMTPADGNSHRRECSLCGHVLVDRHSWDGGIVNQAATCVETGSATYTCVGCGYSKQEILPVNQNHIYGQWTRVDSASHEGACTLCGIHATLAHTWDEGAVIEAATCAKTGEKEQTCTGCGEVARVSIPEQPHSYSAFTAVDENSHSHSCTSCGDAQTLPHSFTSTYRHNINEHYLLCDGCGYQSAGQPHSTGPEATDTTAQLCVDCGRVLRPAGNHIHNFSSQWVMDEQTHYYACDGCNEVSGLQLHRYANGCDTNCDICGYERAAPHDAMDHLVGDSAGHYNPCRNCQEKLNYAPHTPGAAATIASAQVCTGCGWEITPRLEHQHDYSYDHRHLCACGDAAPADTDGSCDLCPKPFPWWILCIAEALVIAALLILPNKKKNR